MILVEEVEIFPSKKVEVRRVREQSRWEEGRETVERRKVEEGDRTSVGQEKLANLEEEELRILAAVGDRD